jgi:dihydrofolate synthase / folylpolyglutamate synthase
LAAVHSEISSGEAFLLSREQFGMRFGLERMRLLLAELDDPQNAFAGVHVVGTNGKSTTTLMTGAALRAQGLKVGCFTSPHLLSFRERMDIGGAPIAVDDFERAVGAVREAAERLDAGAAADDRVTQFEAVTAAAFVAFRAAAVDVAVVEAGLGGRLDATNVLGRSLVQVLTSVGIDHTEYLGDTVEAIAREKLAVVRSGAALVCGPLGEAVAIVANAFSDERDALMTIQRVDDPMFAGLPGGFVRRNATLGLDAAQTTYARLHPGAKFLRDAAASAIIEFTRSDRLKGRLQVANITPFELRDAAHNEQAAAALAAALPELIGERPVTLLVAMMRDKNIDAVLEHLLGALSGDGVVVCAQASNPRSLPADELAARARALAPAGVRVEAEPAPLRALGRAREIAGRDGALLVTGSNYLLADLLRDPAAPAGATL